ncbi:MAG: hypothetical protein JO006_09540 [Paucibacter sp.]|nr:hypothetical protein [Roseateles sp.]
MIRGHQPLIAMRMRGLRPDGVHITAGIDHGKGWRDWPQGSPWGTNASLEVRDDEPTSSLAPAFRCLVGLTVFVLGAAESRVDAIAEAAREAGAASVYAMTFSDRHEPIAARFYTPETPEWQPF